MTSTIEQNTLIIETGAEKLLRLGKTQVISGAGANGAVPVLAAVYPTEQYKVTERFNITQEHPVDHGQGLQFTNINETEV